MTPPIKIDISDFIRQWKLTTEEASMFAYSVLDEIGVRFADQLRNQAGRELKQTRQEYQRSIYIEKPDDLSIVIGLSGWLANAVEKGIGPFDLKEGFRNSSKVKLKPAGGWYMTIPFRHGISSTIGDSSIFANIMPGKVYEIAKQKLADRKSQLTIRDLPPEFQIRNVRPEVYNRDTGQRFGAYQHKNNIYEGMKNLGAPGHSQYVTFRRVSDMSDPMSWIHTGITAHNLFEKTLNDFPIADIISQVKEDFLENR